MADRRAIATELRTQLHRVADLIADYIEPKYRAAPSLTVIPGSKVA